MVIEIREPTYTTPHDVAITLDLCDRKAIPSKLNTMEFSDITHPTLELVIKMILANEDLIDRQLGRSWREHVVETGVIGFNEYWHDENPLRSEYFHDGGYIINLHRDIRPWNPDPKWSFQKDEYGEYILVPLADKNGEPLYVQERDGTYVYDDDGKLVFEYVLAYSAKSGEMEPTKEKVFVPLLSGDLLWNVTEEGKTPKLYCPDAPIPIKMVYPGDKIEVRTNALAIRSLPEDEKCTVSKGGWLDISRRLYDSPVNAFGSVGFSLDRVSGKLLLNVPLFTARNNSVRIRYRYGSTEPVPPSINRLACLMTAEGILKGSYYHVTAPVGGDAGSQKEQTLERWRREISEIKATWRRPVAVAWLPAQ